MWSDPIILCNDNRVNTAQRPASGAEQRRDAVIQLVSIISIVVQSAGSAYQRSNAEGDRVVRTVCDLSRQALAELRAWPLDQASHEALGHAASLLEAQTHVRRLASPGASAETGHARNAASAALLLTPRDRDVMRLIVQGLSNKEIAARLHLTEGTVKGYVSHLLSKLNVRSRTRAATVAIEQGWV